MRHLHLQQVAAGSYRGVDSFTSSTFFEKSKIAPTTFTGGTSPFLMMYFLLEYWGFPIATWGFSLSGNVSIPHHPRDSDPTPERSFSAFVCLPSLRRVWWHGFFSLTHFYPSQNAQNITKFQCTFILDTSENLYHKYSRKVGQTFTPLWSTVTCNQTAALYITPFENAKHFPTTSISRFPCSFGFW